MIYSKKLEARKREIIQEKGHCCKCESKFNLTIDHIIPETFLLQAGFTREQTWDEDNFQVMCGSCNALKGGRFDFGNVKTKPLLYKYLELIK
jgi:5-methylcytosine-specific restriction endonuclease McrA